MPNLFDFLIKDHNNEQCKTFEENYLTKYVNFISIAKKITRSDLCMKDMQIKNFRYLMGNSMIL